MGFMLSFTSLWFCLVNFWMLPWHTIQLSSTKSISSIYGWPHNCSFNSSVGTVLYLNLNKLSNFILNKLSNFILMLVSSTARRNAHWDKCLSSTLFFHYTHAQVIDLIILLRTNFFYPSDSLCLQGLIMLVAAPLSF